MKSEAVHQKHEPICYYLSVLEPCVYIPNRLPIHHRKFSMQTLECWSQLPVSEPKSKTISYLSLSFTFN